jgi:hypothetical protein
VETRVERPIGGAEHVDLVPVCDETAHEIVCVLLHSADAGGRNRNEDDMERRCGGNGSRIFTAHSAPSFSPRRVAAHRVRPSRFGTVAVAQGDARQVRRAASTSGTAPAPPDARFADTTNCQAVDDSSQFGSRPARIMRASPYASVNDAPIQAAPEIATISYQIIVRDDTMNAGRTRRPAQPRR